MKGCGWRGRKDREGWLREMREEKVRLVRDASVCLSKPGVRERERERVDFRQVSVSSWHAHPTVYCRWRWVFEGCVRQKLRGRESSLSQSEEKRGRIRWKNKRDCSSGRKRRDRDFSGFLSVPTTTRPRQEEEEEMENRWRARVEKFGGSSPSPLKLPLVDRS